MVTTHAINGDSRCHSESFRPTYARRDLLVALGLDNLFAAVETGGADMVTPMDLARGGLDRRRRIGQEIVRAMHSAL